MQNQTNAKTDEVKPLEGKSELVNKTPETKLVKPSKKIKIKILRDVADPRSASKESPEMLAAGSVIEVDVITAKTLLNRKYPGMYEFSGERESIEKKGVIRMAERYVEPEPILDDLDQE